MNYHMLTKAEKRWVESFEEQYKQKEVERKKQMGLSGDDLTVFDFQTDPTKRHEFELAKENFLERIHFNIDQLGEFIQKSATKEFLQSQSAIGQIGEQMKMDVFYPWIREMTEKAKDRTETDLTVDLYTSHYDLNTYGVQFYTSDLLKLSNMLWKNIPEICVDRGNDALDRLVHEIMPPESKANEEAWEMRKKKAAEAGMKDGIDADLNPMSFQQEWPEWIMKIAEKMDLPHNFTIMHRFLEMFPAPCFCRESQAAIPRLLANSDQKSRADIRYVKPYRPDKGDEIDGQYPFRDLEALFLDLGRPIQSEEFLNMKYEFEELQKTLMQSATRTPDYGLIDRIEKAKKLLDKMRQMNTSEDELVDFIEEAIQARQEHKDYLDQVAKGGKEIEEIKIEYHDELKTRISELTVAIELSESAQLPPIAREKAIDNSAKLKLAPLERQRKNEKKKLEQMGPELQDLPRTLPTATYPLGWLRAKKIIVRMDNNIDASLQKSLFPNLYFQFRYMENGDWDVDIIHVDRGLKKVLREFVIRPKDISMMKQAGKTAKLPFSDGFVTLNCFNLIQLLARIAGG